jgi:hypothetical protein
VPSRGQVSHAATTSRAGARPRQAVGRRGAARARDGGEAAWAGRGAVAELRCHAMPRAGPGPDRGRASHGRAGRAAAPCHAQGRGRAADARRKGGSEGGRGRGRPRAGEPPWPCRRARAAGRHAAPGRASRTGAREEGRGSGWARPAPRPGCRAAMA